MRIGEIIRMKMQGIGVEVRRTGLNSGHVCINGKPDESISLIWAERERSARPKVLSE